MVKIGQSRGKATSNLAKKSPSFSEQYQIRQSKYPPLSHVYFEVWKKRKCIFLLCGHCCLLKPIDSPLRPAADEIQVFFLVRKKPEMH